jgi:hypothetical protein
MAQLNSSWAIGSLQKAALRFYNSGPRGVLDSRQNDDDECTRSSGLETMLCFFFNFRRKNRRKLAKKSRKNSVFTQNTASLCKKIDHNMGFSRKTAIFSPKIWGNR